MEYLLLLENVLLTQLTVLLPKLQQQQLPVHLAETYGKPKIASKTRKKDAAGTRKKRRKTATKLVQDAKVCSFGHEKLVMVFFYLL